MSQFAWALHQVVDSERMFEIDVWGLDVPTHTILENSIAKMLFNNGVAPDGVSLRSTLWIGYERWRVQWAEGKREVLFRTLNGVFQRFLLLSYQYSRGWKERAKKDHASLKKDHASLLVWRARPQKQLGGRSVNDLWELRPGAYEIVGRGFVYHGMEGRDVVVEFHSYFKDEKVTKDIRWYLERGTSLTEAISLFNRRQRQIDAIAAGAFAVALAGSVGNWSSGQGAVNQRVSLRQLSETVGVWADSPLASIPSTELSIPAYRDLFQAAIKHFDSSSVEVRIRELNKKRPTPIVKLSTKK